MDTTVVKSDFILYKAVLQSNYILTKKLDLNQDEIRILVKPLKKLDPWGSDYYVSYFKDKNYLIISCGPDRKFGTDDDILDLIKLD